MLHATEVAIDPITVAFEKDWPEAEIVNLLDDSLSPDRAQVAQLSESLTERFVLLGKYGYTAGADAILVTCSAFGPAIDRMKELLPIPVMKPNEAMFRAALSKGDAIAMIATFEPAIRTMESEFEEFSSETGRNALLDTILVSEAMTALRSGNVMGHNGIVASCATKLQPYDAVMLAHFSTSRASEMLQKRVNIPVLTAPDSSVQQLRSLFT